MSWVIDVICAVRRHPLTYEGPIPGYVNRLRFCWCSKRRIREPDWPIRSAHNNYYDK